MWVIYIKISLFYNLSFKFYYYYYYLAVILYPLLSRLNLALLNYGRKRTSNLRTEHSTSRISEKTMDSDFLPIHFPRSPSPHLDPTPSTSTTTISFPPFSPCVTAYPIQDIFLRWGRNLISRFFYRSALPSISTISLRISSVCFVCFKFQVEGDGEGGSSIFEDRLDWALPLLKFLEANFLPLGIFCFLFCCIFFLSVYSKILNCIDLKWTGQTESSTFDVFYTDMNCIFISI